MSSDSKRKIVKALMAPSKNSEDVRAKVLKRIEGENAARQSIIRSVEKWTGHRVDERGRVPVVRNGVLIGHNINFLSSVYNSTFSPVSDPIGIVTKGVWAEDTKTLKERLIQYRKLRAAIMSALDELAEMPLENLWGIRDGSAPLTQEIEDKVLFSIGYKESFKASTFGFLRDLAQAIERTQIELDKRPSSRGRPRNEARHLVAKELAALFVYTTGEKPTYSSGPSGYSGKFTPALDELFSALGWEADLEGPAKVAIEAVLPELDKQRINAEPKGILGGLLGLHQSS